MKVLVATSNQGKIREISQILAGSGITMVTPYELRITPNVREDGTTFMANALIKAFAWYRASGLASLADDSGLCVNALGDRPGVHSARFAGRNASDRENYELLLRLMEGVTDRKARFICAVALVASEEVVITAQGQFDGVILSEPVGQGGFGYDPVFLDCETGKSLAQLGIDEKNTRSHRMRALLALKRKIKERGLV